MKRVKEFLQKHWDSQSPLLVGCSGGPDSKALLYALLEAGCKAIHVAHVDHGWREESKGEAALLAEEVQSLGLPFHTTRLVPAEKNKEDRARKERLAFFRELCERHPFQAVVLGHQAQDLAETALKRLFEGAHLPFLGGMEQVSLWKGLPIWRPLLRIKKEELLRFLEERHIQYFIDKTNQDPAYLRSRLRGEIFPFLSGCFGKEVQDNLVHLSDRAYELQRFLDKQVASRQKVQSEQGWSIFCGGLERIEQRHLLQKVAAGEGLVLPRTILEPLLDWLAEGNTGRKISFQSWVATCRNGWVFFLDAGKEQSP